MRVYNYGLPIFRLSFLQLNFHKQLNNAEVLLDNERLKWLSEGSDICLRVAEILAYYYAQALRGYITRLAFQPVKNLWTVVLHPFWFIQVNVLAYYYA